MIVGPLKPMPDVMLSAIGFVSRNRPVTGSQQTLITANGGISSSDMLTPESQRIWDCAVGVRSTAPSIVSRSQTYPD